MMRVLMIGAVFCAMAAAAQARDIQRVVVAGGCFWCVESDFDSVEGVEETISGYAGGTVKNPTYKDVTGGKSGHYEVVQITYDADVLSYETLIAKFLRSVDPTDAGGQFCDRGDSYRTAIFAGSEAEAATARAALEQAAQVLGQPVATQVLAAAEFYPAESYHQDFYLKNPLRYSAYRRGCGRDKRVRDLWGDEALDVHGS